MGGHAACAAGKRVGTGFASVVVALVPTILGAPVWAVDWTYSSGGSVNFNYTDNATLGPEGGATSDFVSVLNTNSSLTRKTRRSDLAFRGAFRHQRFAETEKPRNTFLTMDAVLKANILPERFTVDTRVTQSQTVIDNRRAATDDLLLATDNVTNTQTFRISPRFVHNFENFAVLTANGGYREVRNSTSGSNGGSSQDIQLSLRQGPAFQTFGWGLDYSYRRDNNTGNTFSDVTISASKRVRPKLTLNASTGFEDNSFQTVGREPTGGIFNLGARWIIDRRNDLSLSIGRRFFSTTYGMNYSHQFRNGSLNAGYTESLETTQRLQEGRLIFDEAGEVLIGIELPTLTDDVFVQRRFNTGVRIARGRSRYNLSGFYDVREFQGGGGEEDVWGFTAGYALQFNGRLSGNLSFRFQDTAVSDTGLESQQYSYSLGVSYTLSRDYRANLSVKRSERESNRSDGFVSNTVGLGVSAKF
ncbi:MAG: TIGR03016 family PEP-CTERM system-associated outer membrane protein [Gammaproteobacteria bacterium]